MTGVTGERHGGFDPVRKTLILKWAENVLDVLPSGCYLADPSWLSGTMASVSSIVSGLLYGPIRCGKQSNAEGSCPQRAKECRQAEVH